jgi:hypothetical protein
MKKRLLKDLPFENIKANEVIFKGSHGHGNAYCISMGTTIYSTGGDSDNGCKSFDEIESSILDTIWDNPQWFEEAKLSHIKISHHKSQIILDFPSQDLDDALEFAKVIQHLLVVFYDQSVEGRIGKQFKGFTTEIK